MNSALVFVRIGKTWVRVDRIVAIEPRASGKGSAVIVEGLPAPGLILDDDRSPEELLDRLTEAIAGVA